jgi:hypothetical protein
MYVIDFQNFDNHNRTSRSQPGPLIFFLTFSEWRTLLQIKKSFNSRVKFNKNFTKCKLLQSKLHSFSLLSIQINWDYFQFCVYKFLANSFCYSLRYYMKTVNFRMIPESVIAIFQ